MSTIQITKQWKPESDTQLFNGDNVKKSSKQYSHSPVQNSNWCAKDMMGLSWVLFDELELVMK